METKTFAELGVVALRPDRQEMNSLTGREITPRGVGRLSAEFYYLAGIPWLFTGQHSGSVVSTVASQ